MTLKKQRARNRIPLARCLISLGSYSSTTHWTTHPDDNLHFHLSKKIKSKSSIKIEKKFHKVTKVIETHNFAKQVQVVIPTSTFSLLQESIVDSVPVIYFYRIKCTIGDILLSDFFDKYIKTNSCQLISETSLDHEDVFAVSNGTLHLSLQKDTFNRAGLSNQPFIKPSTRTSNSYRFSYDLRGPNSIAGKSASYDRLRWALSNTLNSEELDIHTFAFATQASDGSPIEMSKDLCLFFHSLAQKRNTFFEAYDLVPSIDTLENMTVPIMTPPETTYIPITKSSESIFNIFRKDKNRDEVQSAQPVPLPHDLAQETIQEWAHSISEWLSLVSLNSDRVKFNDSVDNHISSYELLNKNKDSPYSLTLITWSGGLISSFLVSNIWSSITSKLSSPEMLSKTENDKDVASSSWAAVIVHGVEDAPVSWGDKMHVYTPNGGENNYTIIKLPSAYHGPSRLRSSSPESNSLANKENNDNENKTKDDKKNEDDAIITNEKQHDETQIPYLLLQFFDANDP